MPIITVKVFEGELTWGQTAEMIEDITEAVIRTWGRLFALTPGSLSRK